MLTSSLYFTCRTAPLGKPHLASSASPFSTGSLSRVQATSRPLNLSLGTINSGVTLSRTMPRNSHLRNIGGGNGGRGHGGHEPLLITEDERDGRRKSSSSSSASSSFDHPPPPGIQELETLYAPMKNLMQPLPNARRYSGVTMPQLHPLSDLGHPHHLHHPRQHYLPQRPREDDLESVSACSVIADIPPPPAPVQSHALLEESLGHELPRTPMLRQQQQQRWSNRVTPMPPPSLPRQAMQRPGHLKLHKSQLVESSSYSNHDAHAHHRASLMSTGSSENITENSSESSVTSNPGCGGSLPPPMSPNANSGGAADQEIFRSWTNYSQMGWSPVAPAGTTAVVGGGVESPVSDHEHRSVSQLGDPADSVVAMTHEAASDGSSSGAYVKMNKPSLFPTAAAVDKENHYMNILYNAVQRQGGGGSVESAMSPYMNMNGCRPTSRMEESGAIYAQPTTVAAVRKRAPRVRSSSASRLSEISSLMRRSRSGGKLEGIGGGGGGGGKSRAALLEFKELMREVEKKRHFRVGLNLFNSKPELGVEFLVQKDFLELSPSAVAKFLKDNSGLSRDKVGEYLGDLQSPFSMRVLSCFMQEFNFKGLRIDKSLRLLLCFVRVPGEAQKIERIMEEFGKRYNKCNHGFAAKLASPDSVVTLAFACLLLNTDLHSPSMKDEKRMTLSDFVRNLRSVDAGKDFDARLLKSIYKGIKKQEFLGGVDHVLQTQLIQQTIQGAKRPNLAEPHRRLVCVCRLFEVDDVAGSGHHQRDVFLFNDIMVIAKETGHGSSRSSRSSKSSSTGGTGSTYSFKSSFELHGLEVRLFQTPVHRFGIQIGRKGDPEAICTLNAGSEHDRYKFVMDIQESIFEMDLMDSVLRRDDLVPS